MQTNEHRYVSLMNTWPVIHKNIVHHKNILHIVKIQMQYIIKILYH